MVYRVLVVDYHDMVRQGLCALLESDPRIEVIGEARDGREAIELARRLRPRVVVMDIGLPELNGLEAAERIRDEMSDVKVLILSLRGDRKSISKALRAGATGYIKKDCAFEELSKGIQVVAEGKTYLSPKIAEVVVDDYVFLSQPENVRAVALTPREREVLQLLSEGNTTKEMAAILGVSVKTVETHRRNIKNKLKLDSVAELTKYAIQEGITSTLI